MLEGYIYSFKPSQLLPSWFSCGCHVMLPFIGMTGAVLWDPVKRTVLSPAGASELPLEVFLSHAGGDNRAMAASLGSPILLSLKLPTLLCPSSCATLYTMGRGQLVVRFLVCMYLFIRWDSVRGTHLVSRMQRYSFSHVHIRPWTSFRHWHELNCVHQPSEMCDLCLLFSLCIVCALCCVCLRNKPLISSGRWVQHVPSFLCLPECLCFWN